LLKEFFLPSCNVFCYGQVESKYGSGQFLKDLQKEFAGDDRILLSQIENRDKILDSIKDFLGKGK
ncbi:MAG: stress response protein, partial [Bdellovibrio sp.]